jgi:hypothetical protein
VKNSFRLRNAEGPKTPFLSSLSRNDLNIPSARWSHHRTGTHDLVILLLAPCGPPFSECERLFGGCRCNTPGVYRLLDNEYEFKHVISVDKTDAKF